MAHEVFPVSWPAGREDQWARSCIDGIVVATGLLPRMRSLGYKEALSGRWTKHLCVTAGYTVLKPIATEDRLRGLRLGDMASGYTRSDGTEVRSGWDIYRDELEGALAAELASLAVAETAVRDARAEQEEEAAQLEEATQGPPTAGGGGGGEAEEATQQPPLPPPPPLPPAAAAAAAAGRRRRCRRHHRHRHRRPSRRSRPSRRRPQRRRNGGEAAAETGLAWGGRYRG